MKRFTFFLSALFILCGCPWLSAHSQKVAASGTEPSDLCKRLNSVRHMPFQNEHVDDQVYNEIMAKGSAMTPCLVEQLTNGTKMPDPRSEPTVEDFRVGDLAFFLLLRITGVPFEQMLPENVKAKVKEEGVYAYFRYTELPANRAALQRRWKAWLNGGWPRVPGLFFPI